MRYRTTSNRKTTTQRSRDCIRDCIIAATNDEKMKAGDILGDIQSTYIKTDLLEDTPLRPSILSATKSILLQCACTLLFLPLSLAFLPLYIIGLIIWGRPPTVSPWSRFYRYFTATLTEGKPEEGIPFTNRILIFIIIFDYLVKLPIKGIGWFLDEIFYPSYHKCEIKDPLFLVSAMRSGSTQFARYLEDDEENFIAPMMVEAMFPYIWAWKLIAPILKMMGLKKCFDVPPSMFGGEMMKRHIGNYFKTDTWELVVGLGHMTVLSVNLGASFCKWAHLFSALKEQPVDREFCKIFIEFNDCIMKKVMYHRGLPKQRMFIKTHLLIIAGELEQRYGGAKFLTIIRNPVERLRSSVNFVKVGSADGPMNKAYNVFPMTWRVARDWIIETQICYCEEEMIFYNQSAKNKLVISFDSYVKNLAGTLQRVYSFLNISVSVELLSKAVALQKSSHDHTKKRATYDPKYNRSLSSLGIDEEKLKEYLSDYINWMNRLSHKQVT